VVPGLVVPGRGAARGCATPAPVNSGCWQRSFTGQASASTPEGVHETRLRRFAKRGDEGSAGRSPRVPRRFPVSRPSGAMAAAVGRAETAIASLCCAI
jgi:hypothetical protein